jgi:Raf kinase inhibitor-like YbhB/YbcL family protein
MAMSISSPAFEHGGEIPAIYTCEGRDISPELIWEGVPTGAASLALIVDDPDAPDPEAPKMTYVHWVLYNLPIDSRGLPEAESGIGSGGLNDWKRKGYGGPCPPIGRHRYFFKLYALSEELPDLGTPTKEQLLDAMQGKVLEQAELIGTYIKQ